MVDVCNHQIRMIYHPAVSLSNGSLVISTFYFFRKQNFIVKALEIAFFCIEAVGIIRKHQTVSNLFLRIFLFQCADCSGAHIIEPPHVPVQKHYPAFGFYKFFQCFFDFFTDICFEYLLMSDKNAGYHFILLPFHFSKQKNFSV